MRRFLPGRRFQLLVATVWAGMLWTTGYLTAPTLFAVLNDRALAGTLAGAMFTRVAYVGMIAAVLLLVSSAIHAGRAVWRERLVQVALLILMLTLIGQFGIQPQIAALRQSGATASSVFALWHGVASVVYLIESMLAIGLVFAAARRR